ncbi:peptide ABC transporter substrate-binding protein [Staphylococcus simiae]|uniref:peptide ABC transporter substrate-binding protein n=1 Tax=Staphylococcus simiae TaxID=308354 RepID=UPI001A971B4B|nr:peptide ABC transporter substrate-binding protein [Staphylococcus simiae]MBO1199346.1 peptide ABC transporter substrate-binding protein [Staphylococcus simiae]MBO1201663.1 peptide ABC transporter substrate-binding protein [Staphylococcus simiae]MBO1203783.1 peptide ABC transporter substrate-binding protein [Staphylococcus simiae]MBO1211949.1 peptide ABC transporter substrate-binding protein [Staphylococcus simiae]MBO1230044.1 peptide ABC transporter substrate-binding protein [Staphylococcus
MAKIKIITILLTLSLLLTACGGASGKSLYDDSGQTYRVATPADMNTLDTALATDNVSFTIYNQVFEGLYTLDKDDKAIPGVAKEAPKKTNGDKTWTIKLRKDAKWSNGDPVTAHDFVYAWQKAVDPSTASEYAYIMYDIKNAQDINLNKKGKKPKDLGVKALDDYTLRIELTKPIPYFQEMLAFGTFMPQNEKVVKKYGKSYGTSAEKVVFNGPFKLDEWKVEDKIKLVKNNDYWDKKKVRLDKVNYKILKDQQAGASLYDTGSIDSAGITAEQVQKYKDSPAIFKRLLSSTFFLKLNEKEQPEFKNKDMRLAVAKSINKKAYVDKVLDTGAKPFDGFTARGVADTPDGKDFASTIDSPLKFNVKDARKHLAKAKKELGKNKFTFTLNTEDTPDSKISAEFIKSQIENNLPGVTVKIKQLPFKQRVEAELSMNYSMSLSGWGPDYPDPLTFLDTMRKGGSQNGTGWGNKEYDQLLDDANGKLLRKPEERFDAMRKAEYILLDDAAVAPIYQKGTTSLKNPQVKNIVYHQMGGDYSLKEAYIDKSIDRETGKKKK